MEYVVIISTVPQESAEKVSNFLVRERLAACVTQIHGSRSIYWWEGKVESATETLLIIKTLSDRVEEIKRRVKEFHPYEVPELIVIPVRDGLTAYLNWISDSLNREEKGR